MAKNNGEKFFAIIVKMAEKSMAKMAKNGEKNRWRK